MKYWAWEGNLSAKAVLGLHKSKAAVPGVHVVGGAMPFASALEDHAVRAILQTLVILIAVFVCVVPLYVVALAVVNFQQPEPIERLIDRFLSGELLTRANLVTLIIGAAPVVVRSVCYRRGADSGKLNGAGIAVCLISIAGAVMAFAAAQYLRNKIGSLEEPGASPGPLGSVAAYQNFSQLSDLSLSVCIFYLATFFGFSAAPPPAADGANGGDSNQGGGGVE